MEVFVLHYRCLMAALLGISLTHYGIPVALSANPPLGILTHTSHAHLDEAPASPGLSVFDDERLSMRKETSA
jgi:hypothetical protein